MKNLKNILASTLALSLTASLVPEAQASAFSDVIEGVDWSYPYVTEMKAGDFVSGVTSTTFAPYSPLSVAQFSTMIANAFYGNTLSQESDTGEWWEKFMSACNSRGAYAGTMAENTQNWSNIANADISRYDMALMIFNLMGENRVTMISDEEISAQLSKFSETIPTEYQEAVAMASYYGFLSGKGTIFDGGASLLRGEGATVLSALVNSPLIHLEQGATETPTVPTLSTTPSILGATSISFSGTEVLVDGVSASGDSSSAVYISQDIRFYEEGLGFTYGAAEPENTHSQALADSHTVVNITEPGAYVLSGTLSLGQIAIDLGEDASTDPSAVVTLLLDGVNVTCEVAPALIFYNVYESCAGDLESPTPLVDTSGAGANVIIADDSVNYVTGSHVARIYNPDFLVLSADGTSVEEYKTLYKYDGAFYSKMSMNVFGESKGNGVLNIYADNEGLDSELHLSIHGGVINIDSGNDGINTNEDNVSVTTINGGTLTIFVHGETGEGDGIDSNGWIVINGGTIFAQACTLQGSMVAGWMGDAGIDSDLGIHINGGTIFASGHMLDDIALSEQTYAVFIINQSLPEGTYQVKNPSGTVVAQQAVTNSFTYLIVSYEGMTVGDYTLWSGDNILATATSRTDALSEQGAGGGTQRPEGTIPEGMMPEGQMGQIPDGQMGQIPDGDMSGGMQAQPSS
ncbi:MAG: carbohydrate-binding domain-containing protein [Eubacteriales bacterium]